MTDLIPVGSEWDSIKNMAIVLCNSGFLPEAIYKEPAKAHAKAAAIMLMSRELGIGPMQGFSTIDVIEGKPTMRPLLMKARVHQRYPDAVFREFESTDKIATFEAARPGDPIKLYSFTIEDAAKLNLLNKLNWKQQPKTMLVWRCIGMVARQVFPDVLGGVLYTPEEIGSQVVEDGGETIELREPKPTTVAQINQEEQKKTEDELAKKLRGEIIAKIVEHEKRGHKRESILEALYLKNVNELYEMNTEKLSGILDYMIDLETK